MKLTELKQKGYEPLTNIGGDIILGKDNERMIYDPRAERVVHKYCVEQSSMCPENAKRSHDEVE